MSIHNICFYGEISKISKKKKKKNVEKMALSGVIGAHEFCYSKKKKIKIKKKKNNNNS